LAVGAQENKITIGGTPLEDDIFTAIINGVTYAYTALATPTVTSIAAGLAALIDAATNLTSTSAVGVITVTADVAADSFFISTLSTDSAAGTIVGAVDETLNVEAIADTLDAINLEDPDYYGILMAKRGVLGDQLLDIEDAATNSESRKKLYGYSTDDPDAPTSATSDIFSVLQLASRDRSIGIWSDTHEEYPECGWFGLQLPKDAGSTNWTFKTISGATPSILSGTAYTNLLAKNANFIETIKGSSIITSEAKVASGEYVDIIRGVDSTQSRIAEDTFAYLKSKDKVPFTNPGMQATAAPTQGVLIEKAREGLYVESSIVVTVPDVSEINITEKANRQFKGTTFSAQLQGAINYVEIAGVVYP